MSDTQNSVSNGLLNPFYEYGPQDFDLGDDGTMDTVVYLPTGEEMRYSTETAWDYRDPDGGLDFDAFIEGVVLPDLDSDPDRWDTAERPDGS